jgi:hypothetical protein
MQTMKSEQHLQNALAELPLEKQPERDLWRGIELGIERPIVETSATTKNKPVWLASAASFALIATLGWFGFQSAPTQPNFGQESAALVEALSAQHRSNVDALLVEFEGQAAVTENWQEQLQELDDAAGAIKLALKEDPANTALLQMLQHIYQQQIALIERVHTPKWQQI